MPDAKKAIDQVRDALQEAAEKLDPVEYREVLEALEDDIKARIEALPTGDEQRDEDRTGEGSKRENVEWKPMKPKLRTAYRFMRGAELVAGAGVIVATNDRGLYKVSDDRGHTLIVDEDEIMMEERRQT